MIVSEFKDIKELLRLLADKKKVVLVGCGDCASSCRVGGTEDLPAMAESLEELGKQVLGWFVPLQTCLQAQTKIELKAIKKLISEADAILSFSCGAGTQSLSQIFPEKIILPAVNTMFLASTIRAGHFVQHCSMCGDCVLGITGGLCPQSLCAKSLMNGPCSGSIDGKCETFQDRDCVWHKIYESLKLGNTLSSFETRLPMNMKDYSKNIQQAERKTKPIKINKIKKLAK